MADNFFWLAINLKEYAKFDKKPILLKVRDSDILEIIQNIKTNALNENYLFHIKAFDNQVFFYSKDIYYIKVSAVKPELKAFDKYKHNVDDWDEWVAEGSDD